MKKLILILIYTVFWRNFNKIIIGLKYHNHKSLRKKKQFILIANHNSHMDTMAIMSAMPSKYIHRVHPIAALDFFGGTKFNKFLMKYLVNASLIPRKKPNSDEDIDPIEVISKLLNNGRSVILYPEGSRGIPGVMSNFKKGIGYLIQKHPEIDVIPVYLDGVHKTLPKGTSIILPYNCNIIFGRKIDFNSLEIDNIILKSEESIHKLTKKE